MKKITDIVLFSFVITAVISTLLISGCADEKAIKIGVISPLTGDLAEPGTQSFNGIKLAVDLYNSRNPKVPIKLIVEDSKALPTDGVNAVNKLITIDKVKLIIGDLTSGVTLAIAPIVEKHRVVLLAPGASNPKVRDAGDYVFRNWASDNYDGEVMAMYLIAKLGKKRAAIIYINNEYGSGLADAFEKTFEKNSGRVVLKEKYEQGAVDFRAILAKLKGLDYDCIYLPGQPRENGLLVKQLKELRIRTTITANLSVESPDFIAGAKESAEGIIFSSPAFNINSDEEKITHFVTAYESRFGIKPDAVAGHGYDAANILLYVLQEVQYDVSRVKDALYDIADFPGVTGKTTFDEKGDVIKDVMIKELEKKGRAVILDLFMIQERRSE